MFICEACGGQAAPGAKQFHRVVETREVNHPYRTRAHRWNGFEYPDDPGGKGTQIVRQIAICEGCNEPAR